MNEYLDGLCDRIDAAMFTGDLFSKKENRDGLTCYIDRWKREMKHWKEREGVK